MRTVVIGASSGLGRCIAVGLARGGARVAMMGRRKERLDAAVSEAGGDAFPVACDATDEATCREAMAAAAAEMGGIDGLVYTPAIGPLARIEDLDAEAWRSSFETNVVGASLATAAALEHLRESSGTAVYLTSVSASLTPPWPGLGAYAVTKAALDKLVDAWRGEHPEIGFTRLVVGECAGGPGDSMTEFASGWDLELAAEMVPKWVERHYMTGALMDVSQLVAVVDQVLRADPSVCMGTVTVAPRLVTPEVFPTAENVEATTEEKK